MFTKYLFFGGPYSNLPALMELKKIAQQLGFVAEQVICTGDLIAYGGSPEEVINEVREWGIMCIQGNVDQQIGNNADTCACNYPNGGICERLSNSWFDFAKNKISKDNQKWLAALPATVDVTIGKKSARVVHGSPRQMNQYIFYSTEKNVKNQILLEEKVNLIIAGHSGIPFVEKCPAGIWLNAGVIGMPANDGTLRAWYAVVTKTDIFIKSFNYQHQLASREIEVHRLPLEYSRSLLNGLWHSTEVLPDFESKNSGVCLEEYLPLSLKNY